MEVQKLVPMLREYENWSMKTCNVIVQALEYMVLKFSKDYKTVKNESNLSILGKTSHM